MSRWTMGGDSRAHAAALRARRVMGAAQGQILIALGLAAAVLTSSLILVRVEIALVATASATLVFGYGLLPWLDRRRRKTGIALVERTEAVREGDFPVAMSAAVCGAIMLCVIFPPENPGSLRGMTGAVLVLAGTLAVERFGRNLLLEYLLLACSAAVSGLLLLSVWPLPAAWGVGTFSFGCFLSGVSLHIRWLRWLRRRSEGDEATPSCEGSST